LPHISKYISLSSTWRSLPVRAWWPRHRSAGEAPESRRICFSQLLCGRPGLRFHEWWSSRQGDASTWQHMVWLAETSSWAVKVGRTDVIRLDKRLMLKIVFAFCRN